MKMKKGWEKEVQGCFVIGLALKFLIIQYPFPKPIALSNPTDYNMATYVTCRENHEQVVPSHVQNNRFMVA